MDILEFKALDYLNTEIIILNGDDFKILWINDAAKAANINCLLTFLKMIIWYINISTFVINIL